MPASHQDSKDGRLTEIYFGSLENQLTRHTTLLSHSLRSYPSTNTLKDVLRSKDLITKLLDGLEVFLGVGVGVMSWNSSNLK